MVWFGLVQCSLYQEFYLCYNEQHKIANEDHIGQRMERNEIRIL